MKSKKPKQVFMVWETSPSDPYGADTFDSVYETLESALELRMERPVHPWGRPDADGVIAAKPLTGWYHGLKIVPVELKR